MNPLRPILRVRLVFAGSALTLAGCLAMLASAGLAEAETGPPGHQPAVEARAGTKLTPVLQSVVSTPRWFKADDGRFHLEYELQLTNAAGLALEVRSVNVLGPAARSVTKLSGGRLEAAMSLLSNPAEPTTTLPAGTVGIVWFDLTFPTRSAIPPRIAHRVTVNVGAPIPGLGSVITDAGGRAEVATDGPVAIAPPLRGGRWVAVVGVHRRSLFPVNGQLRDGQRFAADFSARLDAEGRTHLGDVHRNSSYFNFGQPLVAVAPGKVVAVVDRFPDQIPLQVVPPPFADADGNHVIIRLSKGVYAAYGHIKPGTVRVHPGELVRTGQVIGQLGNSGNTSGPHLHFQLMDRPSFLDADGLPFVFKSFHLNGRIPSLEPFIEADSDPASPPVDYPPAENSARQLQGITGLEVLTFRKG